MEKILNLTAQPLTRMEREKGVVDPSPAYSVWLQHKLDTPLDASVSELAVRARAVALLAKAMGARVALLGASLPLRDHLELALQREGVRPIVEVPAR